MSAVYKVKGMTCDGCVRSVTNAIRHELPDVDVQVDLDTGRVRVTGEHGAASIEKAVTAAGFEYDGEPNSP